MIWQSGMRLIQILGIVLVLVRERVKETLQARVFILAYDDELVNIIFPVNFPPVCPKFFRVDNDLKMKY